MFRKVLSNHLPLRVFGTIGSGHHHQLTSPLLTKTVTYLQTMRAIQTSHCRRDLMEFFDDKKNWGETSIRTGRSWRVDELRIKSNSDLHKLWFILLKERNMLLTMEAECKRLCELFPNPERIDKVIYSVSFMYCK